MDGISKVAGMAKQLKSIIESGFFGKFGRIRQFAASVPGPLKVFGVFLVVMIVTQLLFSVSPLSANEIIYGGPQDSSGAQFINEFEQGAAAATAGIFDDIDADEAGESSVTITDGAAMPASLFASSPASPSAVTIHTVLPGDTVFLVAKQYGVGEAALVKVNKLPADEPLIVGDYLAIPQASIPQSATASAYVRTSFLPKGFIWPAPGPIGPAHAFHSPSAFYKSFYGVDIPHPLGTPIVASADGIVIQAIYGYAGGYGNHVIIDHSVTGYNVDTMSAHMTEFIVVPGQQVKQGEVIGYMGSTGHSTGPHVHFEVREKNK